jgi:glyoxylase-like metal-dependent hydrolase (beta-lactamase superfamily II)
MSKTKAVAPGIWWVGCGSWGGLTEVLSDEGSGNVFLVGRKGDYALVDAGMPDGVEAVLANAAAAGARPEDIKRIVLTHSHHDHVAGAAELKRRTNAAAAASELAARALGGDAEARKMLFIQDDVRLQVDEVLASGDQASLGPYAFRVLLTPGHIPDAVTLAGEVDGRKVVLTGDTAIGDQGQAKGVVGWLDGHWGSNPRHLLRSIERISQCQADLLLPGHGFPIEGKEKVRLSLEHCAQRLKQLLAIRDLGTMMPLDLTTPSDATETIGKRHEDSEH